MTKCDFCEQVECECKKRVEIANNVFNERKLEILARLDVMEKDIYREADKKRQAGVPLKDRLVDTTNQKRIDEMKTKIRTTQFSAMELMNYIYNGTTIDEFTSWVTREIYYYPELFSI